MVWEIISFARKNQILLSVRGSAAASLALYCLGVTEVDPLLHGLVFERFLNVERKEMPDIDMDFQDDRREEVLNYVVSKYGQDHVAQIITFGTLGAKASIRDVGRALAMPYPEVDRIARYVPNRLNIKIDEAINESPELNIAYNSDEGIKELIDNAYNISKYWIKSQELIKISNGNVCFLKNHNALVNIKNHPFTNETHSLSCIYIIRDPRDVVVSYAKYKNMNYDRAIKDICCKELLYTLSKKHVFPRVDILGSWKYHFLSWKNGMNKMPKIFVKYEDLINDSYGNFYKVIDFSSKILGFKINTEQIEFSIKCSSFKNLKKFENKMGFFENESKSDFFRSGKIGNWKNELSISQIKHIETEFKSEMKLLGYL